MLNGSVVMVVDVGVLPGFVAVILVFLIPPGPDMAFMLAVGLESGRRAAVNAILGIGTGMSVYAIAVVIGIAEAARSFPLLLDAVKVFGAIYLLWLAYRTIRNARSAAGGPGEVSTGGPYLRGVLVTLTNPKVILFFLAILPQFIGGAQNPGLQLAMLGAVNILGEVCIYGTIGVLAGVFHTRFASSRRAGTVMHYIAGAVYLVLAGVIAAEVLARGSTSALAVALLPATAIVIGVLMFAQIPRIKQIAAGIARTIGGVARQERRRDNTDSPSPRRAPTHTSIRKE